MECSIFDPLKKLFELFGEITIHEVLYTLLIIISLVFIYFSRSLFTIFRGFLHGIIKKVEQAITKKGVNNTIEALSEKCDKHNRIKEDIKKHLMAISDPTKQFTSMQYLYEYPSAQGYKAIMEIATDTEDEDLREELICHLCTSIHANGLYII